MNTTIRRLILSALFLSITWSTHGQTSVAVIRDPQALAVLVQSLNAVGGESTIQSLQDFRATGTIIYYWAGKEVSGPSTVSGRGFDQFRLDAQLPDGLRSLVFSHGQGELRESSGKISALPSYNVINLGLLTFPYVGIYRSLVDQTTSVTNIGRVEISGREVAQVRVQRHLPQPQDPGGLLAKLMTSDYFVDTQTGFILRVRDNTHPVNNLRTSYTHDIELSDYKRINGIMVPMTVSEKIAGARIWELRLDDMNFNNGLTDADFNIQ
jgi:hypothetical protein